MATEETRLLNAADVSEKLGVCRSKAYSVIKELNKKMKAQGYETIPGRVSSRVLEETYFGKRKGGNRDDR